MGKFTLLLLLTNQESHVRGNTRWTISAQLWSSIFYYLLNRIFREKFRRRLKSFEVYTETSKKKYIYLETKEDEKRIPSLSFASCLKGKVAQEKAQEVATEILRLFRTFVKQGMIFVRGSERRDALPSRFACPHRSKASVRVERFSVKIKSKEEDGFSSRHSASRGVERRLLAEGITY